MYICPKCKEELFRKDHTYACINNHSYDIARSGYVNLLLSKSKAGDNKEMIQARYNFLKSDKYLPLAREVLALANTLTPDKDSYILDSGTGVGYYINFFSYYNNIYAFDISSLAINKASKESRAINFFVASSFSIPLKNNSFDLILNIFSPFSFSEYSRLLKDNGYIIMVTPNKKHLYELKELLYEHPYLNSSKEGSLTEFSLFLKKELEYKVSMNKEDILALVKMTPYYYKTDAEALKKIEAISSLDITCSFIISIYKKD